LGLAAVDAYEKLLHEQLTLNFREHHAAKTASEALELCQRSLSREIKRANDAEARIHGSDSEGMMTIEAGELLSSENERLKNEIAEMITRDEFRAQRDAAVQEASDELSRLRLRNAELENSNIEKRGVRLNELLQIFEIEVATTPYPQIQAALREAKAAVDRLPQAEQEYDEEKKRLRDEVSDRDRMLAKLRAENQEMEILIRTEKISMLRFPYPHTGKESA